MMKNKKNLIITLLVLISVAIVVLAGCQLFFSEQKLPADNTGKGYSFSDKVVIAYYYIWYTKETFTNDWSYDPEGITGEAPLRDVHPILGAYDGYDLYIVEEHVKMAKSAKIDAFAVSWWFDSQTNGMNDRLALVFEKAALHGLKVGIDLEADGRTMAEISQMLRYYLTQYSNHPAVLKVEGKPVILIWGTWNYLPENWQETFNTLETKGLSAFYLVSGQKDPGYLGPFRCIEEYALVDIDDNMLPSFFQKQKQKVDQYNNAHPERPAQWHATIMPGFDERNIPGRDDPPNSAGWKERDSGRYYQMAFEAALASNPDWIHITSFNELGEHSHIEPTQEFGWTYINMTANFVDEFKQQK